MAWSAPPTFTAGTIPTAANFNVLRDDLNYLKGLDGSVTIENSLLLGANALAFGNTTLFRTITSALTSFHIGDTGGAVKLAVYLGPATQSYSGGVTILPAGTISRMASAMVMVHKTTPAGAVQFPSVVVGGSTSIDPLTPNALTFAVSAGGALVLTGTAGAVWTVGMVILYS